MERGKVLQFPVGGGAGLVGKVTFKQQREELGEVRHCRSWKQPPSERQQEAEEQGWAERAD